MPRTIMLSSMWARFDYVAHGFDHLEFEVCCINQTDSGLLQDDVTGCKAQTRVVQSLDMKQLVKLSANPNGRKLKGSIR